MRAFLSLISLLMVLAIVGVLAKKQLGGTASVAPAASPQQQQAPQQVQQTVEGLMQQPRPMPEDTSK